VNVMNRTETLELLIVVNVAATLGAVFYAHKPFGGFFTAISIAFINNSIVHSTGNLLLYSSLDTSTISGDQIYMYIVHALSGLPFDTMQRLPVNHVLIAMSLFVLARRLTITRPTRSAMSIAATVSIIFLLNTAYEVGNMSFFVKGAGTIFYLLFVLLLLKYSVAREKATLTAILILFVANSFFDYTAQVWMIVSVIPFVFLGTSKGKNVRGVGLWNILILMAVVFLAYRSIVYTAYVPWMTQVLISSSIQSFVHTLPFFQNISAYPFQGDRPFALPVFIANVLTFAITVVVTGHYLLRVLWMKARGQNLTREDLVFLCLFLPIPLTVAIYLPIGHFNLSYAVLVLPLLAAYCIWVLTKRNLNPSSTHGQRTLSAKLGALLPVLLVLLLVLGIGSYIGALESGTLLVSSNSEMDPGANWLFGHTDGKIGVLSDLDSLGKLLIARSSFLDGSFDNLSLRYYDPQSYAGLVNGNSASSLTYVVVDARTSIPVSSVEWQSFQPLSRHISEIGSNPNVSQIYDDGTCLIEVWHPP